jgi:hypothetical protein
MADLTSLPNSPDIPPPRAINANKFLPDADNNVPIADAWGDDLVMDTAIAAPSCNNIVDGAITAPSCNDFADGVVAGPSCDNLADSAIAAHLWEDVAEAAVAVPSCDDAADAAVAASLCNDVRLWQCIVVASALVWAVPNMFPTQVDACYCLLHPHHPNHLAIIRRTGVGKTHILHTLGIVGLF